MNSTTRAAPNDAADRRLHMSGLAYFPWLFFLMWTRVENPASQTGVDI